MRQHSYTLNIQYYNYVSTLGHWPGNDLHEGDDSQQPPSSWWKSPPRLDCHAGMIMKRPSWVQGQVVRQWHCAAPKLISTMNCAMCKIKQNYVSILLSSSSAAVLNSSVASWGLLVRAPRLYITTQSWGSSSRAEGGENKHTVKKTQWKYTCSY